MKHINSILAAIIILTGTPSAHGMGAVAAASVVVIDTTGRRIHPFVPDASEAVIQAICSNQDSRSAIRALPDAQLNSRENSASQPPIDVALDHLDARALSALLDRGINISHEHFGYTPFILFILSQLDPDRTAFGVGVVERVINAQPKTARFNKLLGQRIREVLKVIIARKPDLIIYNMPDGSSFGVFLAVRVCVGFGTIFQQALIEGLLDRNKIIRQQAHNQMKIAFFLLKERKRKREWPPVLVNIIIDYSSFLSQCENDLLLRADNTIKNTRL